MDTSTGGLNLKITSSTSFDTDDIKDTIVNYGKNFLDVEKYLRGSYSTPEDVADGNVYEKGRILWNRDPVIGSYVGWVNTRTGTHAPNWKPKQEYLVGSQIKAIPDNGNVYTCTVAGKSMPNNPTFLVGVGIEFYDAVGNSWFPSYVYNVGDVVFASSGSKIFYYTCETAGITSGTEPSWSTIPVGGTRIDGSVVWRKENTIRWKQSGISAGFRPFGKVE